MDSHHAPHHHHHQTVVTEHVLHLPKKSTIIKDRVGCVRTSTYNLPVDGFTYGKKTEQLPEGAGESESFSVFLINH
jgi:hypothetical protein